MTPDSKHVWVSDEIAGLVEIIDLSTLAIVGQVTFDVPGLRHDEITPVDMAISHDGKTAYVTLGRANRVAVVDVATLKTTDFILTGKRPWGLRLSRDETRLYVANGLSDDVAVVDTAARRVIKAVPVGVIPYAVLIDE